MGYATDQLCDAARMGDENLVRKLLDDGTNVHGSDDPDHDRSFSGKTPLWITCRNAKGGDMMQRYLGVVRLLIERGARVNDGGRGAERGGVLGPPLYQVCYGFEMEHNMVEIAAALIDGGADVNAGAKWTVTLREAEYGEETPLWAAAKSEHLGLVRLLLARGAATEPIVGGLTPRNSMWPLGAGFHSGLSGMAPLPLYYACGAGLVEVVRALLDAGADPAFVVGRVQCPRTGDVFDVTPLWNACGWAPQNGATMTHVTLPPADPGRTACGRLILDRMHVDHKTGQHGRTQLHGACIIEKTDVVRGLLLLGADINLADGTGKTPLDFARRYPRPAVETPTHNGALETLLEDYLPSYWKLLFAITFRAPPRKRCRRRRVPRTPLRVFRRGRRHPTKERIITNGHTAQKPSSRPARRKCPATGGSRTPWPRAPAPWPGAPP